MKKSLLWIFILAIIFIFCGCTQFKNSDELKTAAEKDEVVLEGKSSMDEEEKNNKEDNDLVEVSANPELPIAYSEEEFIEIVKAARREYGTGTQKDVELNKLHKLNELDFYYRLVEIPEDYEFTAISANEWSVFIYYNPISAGGNQLFDYYDTLLFTMKRYNIGSNPLAPVKEQLDLEKIDSQMDYYFEPNYAGSVFEGAKDDSNPAFIEAKQYIYWAQEESALSVWLPEKYRSNKDIAKYCVAEKVMIE